MRGLLIVFEGIDGSGTTTQAGLMKEKFSQVGLPAHVTAQPSSGPVGVMIRQILSGRLVTSSKTVPGWATMSLLFAADRQDHQENEIEPNLRDGVNVVCDRYVPSSLIYQGACSDKAGAVDWVSAINSQIRKPDVIFYLKASAEVAASRRAGRGGIQEIYETDSFQQKLAKAYDDIALLVPDCLVVPIDAELSIDEIHQQAWQHIETIRSQGSLDD